MSSPDLPLISHSSAAPAPARPIIGITIDIEDGDADRYSSPCRYSEAVERAGGLPLLLPYRVDPALVGQYLDILNGILFSGGDDLDPALFDQPRHPKAIPVDPLRQRFELALIAEVERRRLPALGVCMGSQLMNVHRGGSLIQFLPDVPRNPSIEHRKIADAPTRHDVNIDQSTRLGKFLATPHLSVNTYHKQAADRLGRGLRVVATAPDGVIEGFEDPSFPLFAAVQWHPERLIDEPQHMAPFRLLVDVAAGRPPAQNG